MRCVLIFAGLLVAAGARSAPGQDKVVLRHGNLGGKMTISGTVEDYTYNESHPDVKDGGT